MWLSAKVRKTDWLIIVILELRIVVGFQHDERCRWCSGRSRCHSTRSSDRYESARSLRSPLQRFPGWGHKRTRPTGCRCSCSPHWGKGRDWQWLPFGDSQYRPSSAHQCCSQGDRNSAKSRPGRDLPPWIRRAGIAGQQDRVAGGIGAGCPTLRRHRAINRNIERVARRLAQPFVVGEEEGLIPSSMDRPGRRRTGSS